VLSVLVLVVLLAAGGILRLLTAFDRALVRYARLSDGEQAGWYRQVKEVDGDQLAEALYKAVYSKDSTIPAVAPPSWAYNVMDGGAVHALKSGGTLYIVLHKWVGDCAGVCVPVADTVTPVTSRELSYFPIRGSRWQYWKADFE